MAVQCWETSKSGVLVADAKAPTGRLEHVVTGTTDAAAVIAAVEGVIPLTHGSLIVNRITPDPQGGGVWLVHTNYAVLDINPAPADPDSPRDQPTDTQALGPEFAIDISAGTQHISQSTKTVAKYKRDPTVNPAAAGDIIPDYNGAIGVTRDNRVEGADKFVPQGEMSFTVYIPVLNLQYVRKIMGAVGTTNLNKYYGFQPGEVLFLGCSVGKYVPPPTGTQVARWGWPLTYKFGCGVNQTQDISPEIKAVTKAAWDYLWCFYAEVGGDPGAPLVIAPKFAFVERIYAQTDFKAVLGV